MNQTNTINTNSNLVSNNTVNNTNNNVSEIQEFFNYVNSQNNMNLKKIILFYSSFSKLCEQFINSLHSNYKFILHSISVDNSNVRKRLMNSKFKLQYVPCIFMLFNDGKVNIHYGNELLSLVAFLNKNMEAFIILKTNGNLTRRNNTNLTIQNTNPQVQIMEKSQMMLNVNNMNNMISEPMHQRSLTNVAENDTNAFASENVRVTPLNIQSNSLKSNKMKTLPRIKQPIPQDFKKEIDVGISSKRMIPKGRKEHRKMAHSSLNIIQTNKQLDTIEEEDEETTDEEEEINIQMEDGEILDNILEENEDQTIDPIIKKGDKKDIKEIAAEMAKDRGDNN